MSEYTIINSSGFHKQKPFDCFCDMGHRFHHEYILLVVVRFVPSNEWWIINDSMAHDDVFEEVGPFSTHEEAITVCILMSNP